MWSWWLSAIIFYFFITTRYREKAKKDIAAVRNHAAKLLQSLGKVGPIGKPVAILLMEIKPFLEGLKLQ